MNIPSFTAFDGERLIAAGDLVVVVKHSKELLDRKTQAAILIFENSTSRQQEVDFRGTLDEVLGRLEPPSVVTESSPEASRPGRPRLGVTPREVTLLPRHWDWLATQPGGASAALRRLVEEASRASIDKDRARAAIESLDRFMNAMAGNLPHYEEASRAFYRKEKERFHRIIEAWPEDIRSHVKMLAEAAW